MANEAADGVGRQFSPVTDTPPRLFQLLTDGSRSLRWPAETAVVQPARMIPQWFLYAPEDLRSALLAVPGVLNVATVEYEPARFAVGFDQVLATGREAAVLRPNGWAGRDGRSEAIPACPRVSDLGGGIEMDSQVVEPTITFDLASIVLSKEPEVPDVDPLDPVQVACAASAEVGVTPILAAGNGGPDAGSLSPWAAAPSVVSVGATSDAAGTCLDARSARGIPDGPGPDLVAYAASALNDSVRGTSFAAPRVAREHATLVTFANAALAAAAHVSGHSRGVPITSVGVVDWGESTTPGAAAMFFGRNPASGVDEPAVARTLERMTNLSIAVNLDPDRVRRAAVVLDWLKRSAKPVPGCEPHEAGAGFVCHQQTWQWCHSATGAHLATLLSDGSADEAIAADLPLARISIADPKKLPQAIDIWTATTGLVYWEHDQQELTVW